MIQKLGASIPSNYFDNTNMRFFCDLWKCLRAITLAALLTPLFPAFGSICQSYTTTTDLPANLFAGTSSASVLARGTVTYVATNCLSNMFGGVIFYAPFSSTVAQDVPGATNVQMALDSGGSISIVGTGNAGVSCNAVNGFAYSSTYFYVYPGSNGTCTYTLKVPIVVTKKAGNVSGSLGSSAATGYYPTLCGGIAFGWGTVIQNGNTCGVDTPYPDTVTPLTGVINFNQIACTVTVTPSTLVLNTVSTSAFTGVGSVAGAKTMSVVLTGCSSATAPYTAAAGWTYTPADAISFPGAMNNSEPVATAATGISIQLLDGSLNPILNGEASNMGLIPSSGGGSTTLLTARYMQTGSTVATGNVKGQATFTLSFN